MRLDTPVARLSFQPAGDARIESLWVNLNRKKTFELGVPLSLEEKNARFALESLVVELQRIEEGVLKIEFKNNLGDVITNTLELPAGENEVKIIAVDSKSRHSSETFKIRVNTKQSKAPGSKTGGGSPLESKGGDMLLGLQEPLLIRRSEKFGAAVVYLLRMWRNSLGEIILNSLDRTRRSLSKVTSGVWEALDNARMKLSSGSLQAFTAKIGSSLTLFSSIKAISSFDSSGWSSFFISDLDKVSSSSFNSLTEITGVNFPAVNASNIGLVNELLRSALIQIFVSMTALSIIVFPYAFYYLHDSIIRRKFAAFKPFVNLGDKAFKTYLPCFKIKPLREMYSVFYGEFFYQCFNLFTIQLP